MWYMEEDFKISRKNSNIYSIRIKVDFYEVCISYIIYCLLFYFKTILIPSPPCQIYGISLTRRKEFIKYWPEEFDLE